MAQFRVQGLRRAWHDSAVFRACENQNGYPFAANQGTDLDMSGVIDLVQGFKI